MPISQNQLTAYAQMLRGAAPGGGVEMVAEALDTAEVRARARDSGEKTKELLRKYFGTNTARDALVDRAVQGGHDAIAMVEARDAAALSAKPEAVNALEAIVRTDGSRPSFLIAGGEADLRSSPLGAWTDTMNRGADQLRNAIACVGRIDVPSIAGGFMGTGMLVGPDVIVTNRHVLQAIAQQNGDGAWQLFDGLAIDFGHEFGGRISLNRRSLKRVLFAGSRPIDPYAIDHTKLDLALIELEPAGRRDEPQTPLRLQMSPPLWDASNVTLFTIGYPGAPPAFQYAPSLLDQLFHASFGYKRVAPGAPMTAATAVAPWTITHDATTLGGSSGSALLVLGAQGVVAGLHYGGRSPASGAPGENWGHRLEKILNETDGRSSAKLQELLARYNVVVDDSAPPRERVAPEAPAQPARVASPAAPPDWRRGVTLQTMQTLASIGLRGPAAETLEASQNGVSPPETFDGRNGYVADFLAGFTIPLPMASSGMRLLRRGGTGFELKYEHFSVIMSEERRMPMLTACNIDGAQSRRLPRVQEWKYDGRLDRDDQWGNDLYSNNEADKGHMVRREDPIWGTLTTSKRANIDTFHYTNCCPQMAVVNQQIWLGLENYVLTHTRDDDMKVSVFTGPFFTADDFSYRGALIPRSFWKIVAFQLPDGRPSATAYRVSQDRELQDLEFVFAGYKTFQISVQQVADGTGIDFSALIPFDGFSQHERVHGTVLTEKLERFEQIRV